MSCGAKCLRRIGATLLGLMLLAGVLGYRFIRTHTFSAREKPSAIETYLARHVRSLALPSYVKKLKNPLAPDPIRIAKARDHFADHCAVCHGNRGDAKTAFGEGLYPPPPDLRLHTTQSLTDGEIFNVIKNGIRFTGMPGFGGDDESNWKLVLFIRRLPNLTDEEVKFMSQINKLADDGVRR